MSKGGLPQQSSPVVNLQESWSEMGLRMLREGKAYLKGPGPRKALHTYRWVLAGILAALLVAAGHWGYWKTNSESYDGLQDKRVVTREGFEIRQEYTGFAAGDTFTIRGRIDEVTVIENFSYGEPAKDYDGVRSVGVSDATNPTLKGLGLNTGGYAVDLAVAREVVIEVDGKVQPPQDVILVADGRKSSGLLLLNTTDPLRMTKLAGLSITAAATSVAGNGTLAMVGDSEGGLTLVDFSKVQTAVPDSLDQRSYRLVGPDPVHDLDVAGDMVYLALGDSGLGIVNISNPDLPISRGYFPLAEGAYDVFVQKGLAYVSGGSAGLQIVDVTNATPPHRGGSWGGKGKWGH